MKKKCHSTHTHHSYATRQVITYEYDYCCALLVISLRRTRASARYIALRLRGVYASRRVTLIAYPYNRNTDCIECKSVVESKNGKARQGKRAIGNQVERESRAIHQSATTNQRARPSTYTHTQTHTLLHTIVTH